MDKAISKHAIDRVAPLLGAWRNTALTSRCWRGFTLCQGDGHCLVTPVGLDSRCEWGQQAVEVCDFQGGGVSLYGRFSLTNVEVELIANTNKGLIVVALYLEYEQAENNYLCREFFVPAD